MEARLPEAFCGADKYFRQCFDIDEATCRSTVTKLMGPCFDKIVLPDSLDTKDGENYGRQLGRCAGAGYDSALASRRNDNPKCLDPKNWQ